MEENSFEKQVQDKMDELKIQPSNAAWENIEPRIVKKKNKKWGILFFLFCIILSGGYLYWNSIQHSISTGERVIKHAPNKTSIIEKSSQEKKSITSSVKQNNNESNPLSVNKKPELVSNTLAYINENITKQYIKSINKKRDLKTSIDSLQKPDQILSKQKTNKKYFEGKASTKIETVIAEQTQPNDSTLSENDSLNQRYNTDSLLQKALANNDKKIKDTSKQTKAVARAAKNISKNKWKIGAVVLPGISFAGNSFVSSNSPSYLSYSATSNNQGLPGRTVINSSTIKPGFAFIAGIFAEKNITKKSRFVIGINYKSFATSNFLNDSTLYSNKNEHENHFNFIEIPLSIKIQVNNKHLPFIWQGGFSVSQLISSNALQFNPASGLYFTNNSFFNKTQIGFNTSLSVDLFSKPKKSLLIGPYFYYGASKIANEGLYNKSHFSFIGLRTEYIFGK